MNKEVLVDALINYLCKENNIDNSIDIPDDEEEKRIFLDDFILAREAKPINGHILEMESQLLKTELKERGGIVLETDIPYINDLLGSNDEFASVIALWQGDITRLAVDVIVNTTNSTLMPCQESIHSIDRLIHSRAGMGLKLECSKIIEIDKDNKVGSAKLTKAYNLPSKYIIHTVAPKVLNGIVTEENRNNLKKCYNSILELAKTKEFKTIAIPCISTGKFHFPKSEAADIALDTVKEFLKNNPNTFTKVILNTYTSEDYNEYKKLL
ncbi:MAG: macro domain-containing protein [Bacilli bacterium]